VAFKVEAFPFDTTTGMATSRAECRKGSSENYIGATCRSSRRKQMRAETVPTLDGSTLGVFYPVTVTV
jgi:hypothetical protein